VNKVILIGNLTRDVELRTAGSTQVGNMGLAVNRKWRDANGEQKEETTFVDCEAWGKTAENIARFFSKGRRIALEGRLKLEQWEKDGQKHSKMKVVVEAFHFCDSKQDASAPAPSAKPTTAKPRAPGGMDVPEASDIPFDLPRR